VEKKEKAVGLPALLPSIGAREAAAIVREMVMKE
jgi:hypothetical protein